MDLEKDNIGAEVIYCNSLLGLMASPDINFQLAVAKAYNDWVMDIFKPRPDRFAPAGILPTLDVAGAVNEVFRLAKKGFRVVSAPIGIREQPYNLPVYEPLWNALEETGLVFSLHFVTGTEDHLPVNAGEESNGGFLSYMIIAMAEGIQPTARMLSGGVPMRHPGLNFVIVECGAGWLPWALYALDEQYERKHMWIEPKLEMKPSEYFKRQGHVTFGDDPVALTTLGYIGDEVLLWGSDYPHDEGTFPHSREVIDRIFQSVPEESKRKIVYENAARLYRFPTT
jgi:predicted TIM-barrel fold metal-dependent hydrolase